jgi:superfamily II DNA/RNA helicase
MPDTTPTPAASDVTDEGSTTPSAEQLPEADAAPAPERQVRSFTDCGVDPALAEALAAKGIHAPFPIQELTLPIATKGHDVIGQARTGTGKTLAFALALLGRVTPGGGTQALVIVPTRELCLQVAEEMQLGQARGLRTIAVYGGVGYEEQEAAFREGHEIVVGTPGRLLDHVNKRNLVLDGVTELVLDEADEMLDMGFLPDVERLIEACATDRHGMLFSATMPSEVVKLARRYLDHPTFMRADHEVVQTAPNVTQHFFQVHRMDKPRVLARILQTPDRGGVYVFVRTKHMADRLVRELEELGTPAIAIHGDLRQATREKNLDRFRDGSATVLVATEVAARGLDVENVTHVINYDCPDDEKMYLHRIGRTARAGSKGVAVTFAEFNEIDRLNVVRKKLDQGDNPVAAIFSTSEELIERFDLPEERPWDAQVAAAKAGTRTDRRSSDDERGGGRGGRGGRDGGGGRKGTSDGRPKSKRSSEGTGNDRDADRSRRDRERGGGKRDEPKREQAKRDEPKRDQAERDQPERDQPERDQAKRDQAKRDEPERSEADREQGRTRTRTRTRSRGGASSERSERDRGSDDRGGRDEPTSSGGRTRARARSGARDPEARRDSDRTGDRGGRERGGESGKRGRSDRDRGGRDGGDRARGGERNGSERSNSERSSGGGGRSRSGRDGGGRGNGRDSGGRSSSRDSGGRSSSRSGRGGGGRDLDPTVTPARRGEEARGDGDPQLARRVKVEHLP